MVAFVIVGLIIIATLNTVLALVNLFKSDGCLEALLTLVLSGAIVTVEVLAVILLWNLL